MRRSQLAPALALTATGLLMANVAMAQDASFPPAGTSPLKIVASYTNGLGTGDSSMGTIDLTLTTLVDAAGGGTGILEDAQGGTAAAATDFTALVSGDLAAATIADTLTNADKAIADKI